MSLDTRGVQIANGSKNLDDEQVFEAALARDIDIAAETLKTHIDKGLEHTLAAF